MSARVLAAVGGAGVWAVLLAAGAVASPWRPQGPLAALLLLAAGVPAATAAGTAAGLRSVRQDEIGAAARVAALGAPPLVLLVLFTLRAVAPDGAEALQQVAALLVGGPAAAGLAARFTGAAAEADLDPPGR